MAYHRLYTSHTMVQSARTTDLSHPPDVDTMRVSLGVFAYNEEAALDTILARLTTQRRRRVIIDEIFVVSSGSTDDTDAIARLWAEHDRRVALLAQRRRRGKSAAINLFLRHARNDLVVVSSADLLPEPTCVERLVTPLADPSVGMTGVRPVPLNPDRWAVDAVVRLMWRAHRRISRSRPKLGEMVAFRRDLGPLPERCAVDEATLEAQCTAAGLRLVHVDDAVVLIRGPKTVVDFVNQRRRIAAGHVWLERERGYRVATRDLRRVVEAVWAETPRTPRGLLTMLAAVGLEGGSRSAGWMALRLGRHNPVVWHPVPSTKDLRENVSLGEIE